MAIELDGKEYWQGLLDRETKKLTDDECLVFLKCLTMESQGIELGNNPEWDRRIESSMAYQILDSRLIISGTKATLPLMLFISSICDSPGEIVMWAYTIHIIRLTRNIEGPVKLSDVTCVFPMGFPTEKGYEEAWDEQKSKDEPCGNMVDNYDNWPRVGTGDGD